MSVYYVFKANVEIAFLNFNFGISSLNYMPIFNQIYLFPLSSSVTIFQSISFKVFCGRKYVYNKRNFKLSKYGLFYFWEFLCFPHFIWSSTSSCNWADLFKNILHKIRFRFVTLDIKGVLAVLQQLEYLDKL